MPWPGPSGPRPSVARVEQPTLIDVAPTETAPPPESRRQTSKGIAAGDIVLVDKKGRRFHAQVTELEQLDSGRFELVVRPLDSRISWRTASVREVVEVWRRVRRA
jgi:hypothetical protein